MVMVPVLFFVMVMESAAALRAGIRRYTEIIHCLNVLRQRLLNLEGDLLVDMFVLHLTVLFCLNADTDEYDRVHCFLVNQELIVVQEGERNGVSLQCIWRAVLCRVRDLLFEEQLAARYLVCLKHPAYERRHESWPHCGAAGDCVDSVL